MAEEEMEDELLRTKKTTVGGRNTWLVSEHTQQKSDHVVGTNISRRGW